VADIDSRIGGEIYKAEPPAGASNLGPYRREDSLRTRPHHMTTVSSQFLARNGSLEDVGDVFDACDLEVRPSDYVAGGDDQLLVQGSWSTLAQALGATLGRPAPLRDAARALAGRLVGGAGTNYARHHNPYLAARVLGRNELPRP
jgi:hypothetical protein